MIMVKKVIIMTEVVFSERRDKSERSDNSEEVIYSDVSPVAMFMINTLLLQSFVVKIYELFHFLDECTGVVYLTPVCVCGKKTDRHPDKWPIRQMEQFNLIIRLIQLENPVS